MSPFRVAITLALLLLIVVTFLFARSPFVNRLVEIYDDTGHSAVDEQLRKDVAQLNGDVQRISQGVNQLDGNVHQLADKIQDVSTELAKEEKATDAQFAKLQGEFKKIDSDFGLYRRQTSGLIARFDDTINQIAQHDNLERWTPSILSNMDRDKKFKREMDRAVNQSLHRDGRMLVRNETPQTHYLLVNNRDVWTIPATGETVTIPVETGTVVTELQGLEAPRNWSIVPPKYEQSLVIR